jgi:hypothetical protein
LAAWRTGCTRGELQRWQHGGAGLQRWHHEEKAAVSAAWRARGLQCQWQHEEKAAESAVWREGCSSGSTRRRPPSWQCGVPHGCLKFDGTLCAKRRGFRFGSQVGGDKRQMLHFFLRPESDLALVRKALLFVAVDCAAASNDLGTDCRLERLLAVHSWSGYWLVLCE